MLRLMVRDLLVPASIPFLLLAMAVGVATVMASLTVILPVTTLTLTMLVSLIRTENGAKERPRLKNRLRWILPRKG